MSQLRKLVPLRKILANRLGTDQATNYLKGINFSYTETTTLKNTANIYQETLNLLLEGHLETAINYIVFGIDLNRNDKLLFNLTKNMIYLFSKKLREEKADFYTSKYADNIFNIPKNIKEKISKLEIIRRKSQSQIKKNERELEESKPNFFSTDKLYVFYFFKKRKLIKEIFNLNNQIVEAEQKIRALSQDLANVEKLAKIEEYLKVLSITLEVCIFPERFDWLSEEGKNAKKTTVELKQVG